MNLFGYEKKNDYFSVLMKLEIYDSVNKMKTKGNMEHGRMDHSNQGQ